MNVDTQPYRTADSMKGQQLLPNTKLCKCLFRSTVPYGNDTGFFSDTASAADVSQSESLSKSTFRPPSRSISSTFDEDKPIASSGAYNLSLIENSVDPFQESTLVSNSPELWSSECKEQTRRKSTDALPLSKSTLTRSLSLQAGEFDGASKGDCAGAPDGKFQAEVFSIGTESAPGTLKKSKKPRPASLKKRPPTKQVDSSPEIQAAEELVPEVCPEVKKKPQVKQKRDSLPEVKPEEIIHEVTPEATQTKDSVSEEKVLTEADPEISGKKKARTEQTPERSLEIKLEEKELEATPEISVKKKQRIKQKPESSLEIKPEEKELEASPEISVKKKSRTKQKSESPSEVRPEDKVVEASAEVSVKKKVKQKAERPPEIQTEPIVPEASPEPSQSSAEVVTQQAEKTAVPLPVEAGVSESVVADEESPIPPKASYNWDPDNFEGIDPFSTGGSKVPNSPIVARKSVTFTAVPESAEPAAAQESAEEAPLVKRQSVRLEFDYSEDMDSGEAPRESTPPPKKLGKKPAVKMPLRKPKIGSKKPPPVEPLDNAPPSQPADFEEIHVPKASYDFDPDKWEDPNFNPFSTSINMPNSPKLPASTYNFDMDTFDDSVNPFKSSNKLGNSPPKSSASFEVPANDNEMNGLDGANQNKPSKKKKTPLKTNTFRVKKSPKRSPLSEPPSQESTPLATPEAPPVIPTEDHATDEEKLASSVTNQKPWTYQGVANELAEDPQDYPQPSDLSDNNFNSKTKEPDCDPSYEIEYMEKIGCSSPHSVNSAQKPGMYLKLDPVKESASISPPVRIQEPLSPCSGLSFDEVDAQFSTGTKSVHPAMRNLASNLESCSLSPEKSKQKEVELLTMSPPEEPVDSTDVLLDRLSRNSEPGEELDYLESDLAETNPPVFAQKLQQMETLSPEDVSISKSALHPETAVREGDQGPYHNQRDLDSALGIAREEIVDKEREVAEWQRKYEESRQEVVEMSTHGHTKVVPPCNPTTSPQVPICPFFELLAGGLEGGSVHIPVSSRRGREPATGDTNGVAGETGAQASDWVVATAGSAHLALTATSSLCPKVSDKGKQVAHGAAMVGGLPSPIAEGGSVHSPAPSWRDRDLAKGNQGALYGPSGAQAGDQSAAAPGRGASPGDSAATSGQPGGAKQETRRPPVPGGAATWESGPATKGPDMEPGCPGAQAEGSNPQAPGCGTGVVVGAVVEVVSSPPPPSSWPAAPLCEAPATV
ncbi:UNVERIFIED_CONTAM: hypothetical protein FKN15_054177 [Acipenser sinensis]